MNEQARAFSTPSASGDFQRWCLEIVDRMTPVRERYTPFPRYFELQALNFLVMRNQLSDLFPFDRRYDSILEIGCGVGVHSALLARFCERLLGVDIPGEYAGYTPPGFKSSAEVATSVNAELETSNASFADAFPDNLPAKDNSIDMIYSWTVLEHVPDLAGAYREMYRVARPGGLMIHIVPNVMSAVDTIMRVNIEAGKAAPAVECVSHSPKGWLGAIRQVFSELKKHAHGWQENRNAVEHARFVSPEFHSEFLRDRGLEYSAQLDLYCSDNFIFPAIRAGFQLERLHLIRDFNYALVFRKS